MKSNSEELGSKDKHFYSKISNQELEDIKYNLSESYPIITIQ